MGTFVFFHAHPDDEAIATGGTMARAAADGHRVVLVVATNGEEGEVVEGFLGDGETLGSARITETRAAAQILGVARVEFLGYRDSGMMSEPSNDHPEAFWQADLDEAAEKLAAILEVEDADVLTIYDDHGGYGHPDHIQVHRVGHRAAASMSGTLRVFEATMNRDLIRQWRGAMGDEPDTAASRDDPTMENVGTPDAQITTVVDVSELIATKRAAMAAHASQISEDSWFFQLPEHVFAVAFGAEWFVRVAPAFEGDPVTERESWLE
ncbi:MAG: PIG-L family deacetylase [Acidimicrobiia bacterium]|nr:PIG-L family deacetylase [Acidimicrobiia bacterium]